MTRLLARLSPCVSLVLPMGGKLGVLVLVPPPPPPPPSARLLRPAAMGKLLSRGTLLEWSTSGLDTSVVGAVVVVVAWSGSFLMVLLGSAVSGEAA